MANYEVYDNLPGFMGEIEEIIEQEVCRRVEAEVKDLSELREKQKKYREELQAARNEISLERSSRYAAERNLSAAQKELEDERKNKRVESFKELLNGWDKVTKAYRLKCEEVYAECPLCHGKHDRKIQMVVDGTTFYTDCPVCRLWHSDCRKYKRYEVSELLWGSSTITKYLMVAIDPITGNPFPTVHENWQRSDIVDLNTCYRTKAEAQAEADKRNEEGRNKAIERIMEYIRTNGYEKFLTEDNK